MCRDRWICNRLQLAFELATTGPVALPYAL
jgi:hypothetical protein